MALQPQTNFDSLVSSAVQRVGAAVVVKDFDPNQVAVTLLQYDSTGKVIGSGNFRENESFRTASVVKLFWLAFAAHQLEERKVRMSPEFQRAAADMIVVSSNDATGYIVNATTGACPGPELPQAEFKSWLEKRQECNKWFVSKGYIGINVLHRTYNEESYGVEKQAMGKDGEWRNSLNTASTARLMLEIMNDQLHSPKSGKWMRSLLMRKNPADDDSADSQAKNFIGGALPKGSKLWSKAGWTSVNRHDVAAFELPTGGRYVLAIFTNYGGSPTIVTELAKGIIQNLK